MNRREFLKYAGICAGLTYTGSWLTACGGGGSLPDTKNPLYIPSNSGLLGYYKPTTGFTLTAQGSIHEIFAGKQTRLLTYQLTENNKTYYNPIIVLRKGDSFNADFKNLTGEKSIIHWHGFKADWQVDGHPSYAVISGDSYKYSSINIIDRSGTYFYHPHPHGRTGYQVYMGLASMIIIEDSDEDNLRASLDLQPGVTDIPLILQDKNFNSDGSLNYNPLGMNGNMGFWGDTLLVNMTPSPYMEVERRVYRFRILNGSNARPYRLALLRGSQRIRFWVIGVEGGLLDTPKEVAEIIVSPGERVDILIDFRDVNLNDVLKLYSYAPTGLVPSGGRNAQLINREFEVLEFRVKNDSSYNKKIPTSLSSINAIDISSATQVPLTLGASQGVFSIDGNVWNSSYSLATYYYTDTNGNQQEFRFNNGEIAVIEFTNNTGMYHPMHLHGFQFQVISRVNSPSVISNLAVDGSGRMVTDLGWKDTVIVAPSETVKIAVDMSHSFGREQIYLLHCHILEHHDAGMMVNYRVNA